MKEAHEIRKAVAEIIEKEGNHCLAKVEMDTPYKAVIKATVMESISLIEINDLIELGCTAMDIKRGVLGISLLITIRKS